MDQQLDPKPRGRSGGAPLGNRNRATKGEARLAVHITLTPADLAYLDNLRLSRGEAISRLIECERARPVSDPNAGERSMLIELNDEVRLDTPGGMPMLHGVVQRFEGGRAVITTVVNGALMEFRLTSRSDDDAAMADDVATRVALLLAN